MKILNIVGARPNFMKMAPIIEALNGHPGHFEHRLVHTGQHYDARMSKAFFDDLGMPKPDLDLEVGSASHAEQTARIMMAFEQTVLDLAPDLVIVVGDVNSTLACTLTAKKLGVKVAHVEAGLRSRDMTMPEEINRLCTDVLCDLLFTTDTMANDNLIAEGIAPEKIHFVGNVMIDTLMRHRLRAADHGTMEELRLNRQAYAVMTLHRPGNVDEKGVLQRILDAVREIGVTLPVIFPVHPRTKKMIQAFGLDGYLDGKAIRPVDPMGYLAFLNLNMNARLVLTDSGGLQEETTVLGVPCITIRPNTERPITITQGTNRLVDHDRATIVAAAEDCLARPMPVHRVPEKWDGKAAERIVDVLMTCKAG